MKKKPEKPVKEVVIEVVVPHVEVAKVAPLNTLFGNGELEVLRAKLNEVIAKL